VPKWNRAYSKQNRKTATSTSHGKVLSGDARKRELKLAESGVKQRCGMSLLLTSTKDALSFNERSENIV
jgi:hypothetical protein